MKIEADARGRARIVALAGCLMLASHSAFAWPDLAITKTAPSTASVGDQIPYTLTYTNKGPKEAYGVTVKDTLPATLAAIPSSLGTGSLAGNTVTWNIGTLYSHKGGKITFQALVKTNAVPGEYVVNTASIQSKTAEEDDDYDNNCSSKKTRIVSLSPLDNQSACAGDSAEFSTSIVGLSVGYSYAYRYQWYKGASLLSGQTNNNLTFNPLTAADAGTYTVVGTGLYGSRLTNSAVLTVKVPLNIVMPPGNESVCVGDTALFSVTATGSDLSYQWYRGTTLLSGQTGNSLLLTSVAASDAGPYSVVISGGCGSVLTNSAVLAVNVPLNLVTPLGNQSACAGNAALFSVTATGSDLSYQWYRGTTLLSGQTGNSLLLTNVAANDAGPYSVVISGGCGSVLTNSAVLTVSEGTTTTPLTSQVVNPGTNVVFTTTASGAGPFSYVWTLNGSVLEAAGSTLVLNNVSTNDEGTYTVEVTGECNTASQSAALRINRPPVVEITDPTNNSMFFAPAAFTLIAETQDPDDVVRKVEFYSSTNRIGETTNIVFSSSNVVVFALQLTNVPAGTNAYSAVATDGYGLQGTSAPVTLRILGRPPLTIVSSMAYDPLTDLFKQTVRVTNPTFSTYEAVRVYAGDLRDGTILYNASGVTNGVPYVQTHASVLPGSAVDLLLEYFSPLRIMPNPTLWAELVPPAEGGGPALLGDIQPIRRGLLLTNGTFMVEFMTSTNADYAVEYSSDLENWKTALPVISGTGTWIQWIDNGQPKTESHPSTVLSRFYKVILLP